MDPSIIKFLLLLAIVFLYILPVIIVAMSKRVSDAKKALWVFGTCMLGWIMVILFFVNTSKPEEGDAVKEDQTR